MQRRGAVSFLFFNMVVSAVIAFGILAFFSRDCTLSFFDEPDTRPERLVTFEVIITATPDPNVTPSVYIITATPMPGETSVANVPDSVRDETPVPGAPAATINPTLFNALGLYVGDMAALPEGCVPHVIADGEYPSVIALQYDVSLFELMAVNHLTEESSTLLQIGDTLIVPLPDCPLEAFITATSSSAAATIAAPSIPGTGTPGGDDALVTPESTEALTPTVTPTPTLPPTATNAQVEIVDVIGAGDVTAEGVVIRNNGNTVNISGWMLSDGDGNTYIFPEDRLLFSGAGITVYTRVGENTPILFFWARDIAVFSPGDMVILSDRDGDVQAAIQLPLLP